MHARLLVPVFLLAIASQLGAATVPATTWASASGTDAIGPWADLTVSGNGYTATMRFRYVQPGTFTMGSPTSEPAREPPTAMGFGKETQHLVTLTKGFWLAESETPRRLWRVYAATDPTDSADDGNASDPLSLPVNRVSWLSATAWLQTMTAANPYLIARLPTEAEWEYACRAGGTAPFHFSTPRTNVDPIVCYGDVLVGDINDPYINGSMGGRPWGALAVKSVGANAWGFHDLHGNAAEWVRDGYVDDLGSEAITDPIGPGSFVAGVLRGGHARSFGQYCRAAVRLSSNINQESAGFRIALRGEPRDGNEAPTAHNQDVSLQYGTIVLTGSDPEEMPLSFAIAQPPQHGVLVLHLSDAGQHNTWTYIPALRHDGPDSFTFTVTDVGGLTSAPATVTLSVPTTNLTVPPVAISTQQSVVAGTSIVIPLDGVVTPGATVTVASVGTPSKGTLSGTGATRTYTPSAGKTGFDRFTFTIKENNSGSAVTGVVRIQILAAGSTVPARPATPAAPTLTVNGSVRTVSGTTTAGATVTIFSNGLMIGQVLANDAGDWSFLLDRLLPGEQAVQVTAANSAGTSALSPVRTVTVPVPTGSGINRRPLCYEIYLNTATDTALELTPSALDPDGEVLRMVPFPLTLPQRGTLSMVGGRLHYTPEPGWTGVDVFHYAMRDACCQSEYGNFAVKTVSGTVDHYPVAINGAVTTTVGTPVLVTGSGYDIDGHAVTVSSYQILPLDGTLNGSGASRTYTPPAGFIGTKVLSFSVTANGLTSPKGYIFVTMVAENQAPQAVAQTVTTAPGQAVSILLGGADPDGPMVNVASVGTPAHGVLSGFGNLRTYTPAAGFTGTDSFTFTVSDGKLTSAPAEVTITVGDGASRRCQVKVDGTTQAVYALVGLDEQRCDLVPAVFFLPKALDATIDLTLVPESAD